MRAKGNGWFLLGLAAALIAAAAMAGAAGAAGTSVSKQKEAALAGSSTWSTSYTVSGRFDGSLGHGTYSGTLTPGTGVFTTTTCGPVCANVTGSMTFSTRDGRFTAVVQPGSVVSTEEIASRSFRAFTLSLRVIAGTGLYSHATGRLSLTYSSVWTHSWVNGVYVDKIEDTGTLAGSVR